MIKLRFSSFIIRMNFSFPGRLSVICGQGMFVGRNPWGLVEDCSDRVIPSAYAHALSVLGFLKQGIPAYHEE